MVVSVRIGPIQLSVPWCQAGLAGYSDRAMRQVARDRGCPYAVTEALLDVILLNGGVGLRKSLDINDADHPVAGQIMGSEPDTLARAALILHEAGYDVIDLNFACPVKKIKNKARGGHMLSDVPRALAILRGVRAALPAHVPTTLKLRRGFDDSAESEDRFFEILECAWNEGYSAVCVHGRTVEQKYVGASRWSFLRGLKERYRDKVILGSGDIFCAEDAVRMLAETKVDGVWIARGAIGNPWIFRDATRLLNAMPGEVIALQPPTINEQRDALAEHFDIAMQIHGEQLAGRRMRKMGIKYSRFHPFAASVKSDFISVQSLRDWQAVLDRWYVDSGPGVWPAARAADEVNDDVALQSCVAEA